MKSPIAWRLAVIAGLAGLPIGSSICFAQASYSSSSQNNNPLAGAQKQVHDARVDVNKIETQMNQIKFKIQRTMEAKDDWKAAKAARDKAHADYEAALRPAIEALHKSPAYMDAARARDEAQAKLDEVNSPSGAKMSTDEINQIASDRTKAGMTIMNLEKAARENDPKVLAAKAKMEQADQDWKALLAQVDEQAKQDPDYAKAEKDLAAAQQKLKQAQTALAQQAKSQEQAQEAAMKARENQRSTSGGGGGGRRY